MDGVDPPLFGGPEVVDESEWEQSTSKRHNPLPGSSRGEGVRRHSEASEDNPRPSP